MRGGLLEVLGLESGLDALCAGFQVEEVVDALLCGRHACLGSREGGGELLWEILVGVVGRHSIISYWGEIQMESVRNVSYIALDTGHKNVPTKYVQTT